MTADDIFSIMVAHADDNIIEAKYATGKMRNKKAVKQFLKKAKKKSHRAECWFHSKFLAFKRRIRRAKRDYERIATFLRERIWRAFVIHEDRSRHARSPRDTAHGHVGGFFAQKAEGSR